MTLTHTHIGFKPGALYQTSKRLYFSAWDDQEPYVVNYHGEAGTYLLCLKWQVFAETEKEIMAHVTFWSLSTLTEFGLMINHQHHASYITEVSSCP